jgi:hypothetical protein
MSVVMIKPEPMGLNKVLCIRIFTGHVYAVNACGITRDGKKNSLREAIIKR